MAQPFLVAELGADARIAVEIAFGADLTDVVGSGWTWTDVTADVRMKPGITTTGGRNDEASTSQPANCSLVLDNATGAYSLGGLSPHYPYVRRNVPVRVRINPDDGGGYRVVFQGYANGFTPGWTDSDNGRIPIVTLSASGILRRLLQGTDPLRSALYRYFTIPNFSHDTLPVEYWPLEEDKSATQALSAVDGGQPGTFNTLLSGGLVYGKVEWGGDTDNLATARAVKVSAGGSISLPTRPELVTADYWAVQWSMRFTSGSGAFVDFYTNGGLQKFRIVFYTSGDVEVWEVTASGSPTRITFDLGEPFQWDDVWHSYTFVVDQTGATAVWTMYGDGALLGSYSSAAAPRGLPTMLEFISAPNPGGVEDPVSVAHVGLIESTTYVSEHAFAADAYRRETASGRLGRLCYEEDIALDVVGTIATLGMGPQRPLPLVALVREVEAADQGVLYDGVGPGLRYVAREQRENTATDLAVSATDLVAPFEPTDDDQRDRNRVVAANATGGKAQYEDSTGPRGTAAIGVYDSSMAANVADPALLLDYASWAVHLGTVEGYRYPAVTMNMRPAAAFAGDVLAVTPSSRITVSDADTTLSLPDATVDVLAEGVTHRLSTQEWLFTAKCSPYEPWIIGTVASETGDTDDDLLRLDTDGAVLSAQLVGVGTVATGDNASVAPALPGGVASGDLILCFAAIRNSGTGTPNTPTGYTLLAGSANARVFGKIAGGSESAPTVSFTGGVAGATTIGRTAVFKGAGLTVQNSAEQLNGSAQNIAIPGLSGIGDNALLVWFGWKADDWTSVDSLGLPISELFESSTTTGDDAGIVVDYLIMPTSIIPGGTLGSGAFTVTGGASAISRGIVLALDLNTAPAGATSLIVETPSGPLWTTVADDYPLDLNVGGIQVTATACSGASSPQIFTVDPISAPRAAGSAVSVWRPRALGL